MLSNGGTRLSFWYGKKMATLKPEHRSRHEPGDPLYVDAQTRLCPGCRRPNNKHMLAKFIYDQEADEYSHLCRTCFHADREFVVNTANQETAEQLGKLLKDMRAAHRVVGGKESFGDFLDAFTAPMGGRNAAGNLGGKIFKQVMRRGIQKNATKYEVAQAVKTAGMLLDSVATGAKMLGAPVDISKYTEEERRELLMEPARQLILTDAAFRKELLDDPMIRQEFAGYFGVQTIEAEVRKPKALELDDDDEVLE